MASAPHADPRDAGIGSDTGRLLTYGASLLGLLGVLFGIAGMIGLLLAETLFRARNLISASDARSQGSYFLATLLVCTPLWLGFWMMAQRRIDRSPVEREAPERRLFFAVILAVTFITALFAVHTVLNVVLGESGSDDANGALSNGVLAGIRLIVYGIAGLLYTRLAWAERPVTRWDPPRDLALYVLSLVALGFVAFGAINALGLLIDALSGRHADLMLGSSSGSTVALWGGIAASCIPGIAVWVSISLLETRYRGVRPFRIPYLAIVLAVSAGVALPFGGMLIYEMLRRMLGYHPNPMWGFVHDVLPPALVGGVLWAYHWRMLWDQARLDGSGEAVDGAIPWTRRPYLAVLAFAGVVATATGAALILWVMIGLVFDRNSMTGSARWRDELCAGLAFLLVGAALWLRPWTTLQNAALRNAQERTTGSRRRLLWLVVAIAALIDIGFLTAALWYVLRLLLGDTHQTITLTDALQYLALVLIAGSVAAYHGSILRGDLRSGGSRALRLRIVALVTPDTAGLIPDLVRRIGHRIEIIGYIPAGDDRPAAIDLPGIEDALRQAAAHAVPRALVVLTASGGVVYPYRRRLADTPVRVGESVELQVAEPAL